MQNARSGRCSLLPALYPFPSHRKKKLYLAILCLCNHVKNTVGRAGSNGILSPHYSSVESQKVYFKLTLDIFAQKFIMEF